MFRAALLVLVLSAVPAYAQTVVYQADQPDATVYRLTIEGYGDVTARLIDSDGDPATAEYLVERVLSAESAVVAVRNGRLCIGQTFDRNGGERPYWPPSGVYSLRVERLADGRDYYVRIDWTAIPELWGQGDPPWPFRTTLIVIALDTPRCE